MNRIRLDSESEFTQFHEISKRSWTYSDLVQTRPLLDSTFSHVPRAARTEKHWIDPVINWISTVKGRVKAYNYNLLVTQNGSQSKI